MDEKGFVEGVRRYMSQLREEKRYSSAKSYQDALNSFIKYSGTENISYSDINKANLHRYEAYLLEKGCMCNTVSTYMRRIRCVYNKAIEDGDAEYIPGLFQGVFTGVESKRKKSLSLENQHKLMTVKVESEVLRETQLVVCLLFQYAGMLDTAELMRKELMGDKRPASGYLFPFLSGTKTGYEAYLEYNAALSRFNRNLKALKKAAGIASDVTSYTIRHSFAMALKEQNVPIEMISELLGHKSIKTTQIYLRSFSLEKMTEVNSTCFGCVYNYVSKVG